MTRTSDPHPSTAGAQRLEVVTTVEQPPPDGHPAGSPSTAELIRQASEQLSSLVRDELALARAEMSAKAKHAGLGAALFGSAGLVALYGVFGVLSGVVLLIARVLPAWGAALAVGAALLVLAGVLGLIGRRQLGRVTSPVPAEAAASIRDDVSALKAAVQRRGGQR
jgi:uncharacterized membrane protein YqjE